VILQPLAVTGPVNGRLPLVRAMVRVSLHYKERGETTTSAMRWRIRFTLPLGNAGTRRFADRPSRDVMSLKP
jgi:hypothetical protein